MEKNMVRKKQQQQIEKKSENHSLVALIQAAKNYDRISQNYYVLSETQRIPETKNYERAKQNLELLINGLLDYRMRLLMSQLVQNELSQRLSELLDEKLVQNIENKIIEIINSDNMLRKIRESMIKKI